MNMVYGWKKELYSRATFLVQREQHDSTDQARITDSKIESLTGAIHSTTATISTICDNSIFIQTFGLKYPFDHDWVHFAG